MVTSVDFHPTNEYCFVSGCMDKKLRLWSIPEGCVRESVQTPSLITAVSFWLGGIISVGIIQS